MHAHVYKILELTGTSEKSIEDAVNNAVRRADKTVEHLRWVQITDVRGDIQDGKVAHWQASIKVGFTLED